MNKYVSYTYIYTYISLYIFHLLNVSTIISVCFWLSLMVKGRSLNVDTNLRVANADGVDIWAMSEA